MKRLLVALIAAAIVAGGCGTEEAEPGLSESISGTWVSEKGEYVTFNDQRNHSLIPGDEGLYEFDADVLKLLFTVWY